MKDEGTKKIKMKIRSIANTAMDILFFHALRVAVQNLIRALPTDFVLFFCYFYFRIFNFWQEISRIFLRFKALATISVRVEERGTFILRKWYFPHDN